MSDVQRVRTVRDLYQVMCIEATPAEWMRRYLFDQPPTMTAQEAWEQCPDEVAMVYVAGLLGVPSDVLVGIAIECARSVVGKGLPEAAQLLAIAEEAVRDSGCLPDCRERIAAIERVVRGRAASELYYITKCATSAAYSAAQAVLEADRGARDLMMSRACEAADYASTAGSFHPEIVQAIVRERLTWAVMAEQLEGLWGDEA